MKSPFLARKTHKWIALIVGVQAAIWMISGAYMAVVDIDFIHGDSLVKNLTEDVSDKTSDVFSIAKVLEQYPGAIGIDLVSRREHPYYVVATATDSILLNAIDGERMPPIDEGEATLLAEHYYAGKGSIDRATLLKDESTRPSEIQTRSLPLWQVRFDDQIETTFYISPLTGELVTRRHSFWRLYDFLWMFHIMDYENRADFNNNLLRAAALIGFLFALSGVWLLIYSLKPKDVAKLP